MAVSFEDVEKAIEQLRLEKKALTLINIRSALGERGSMTTLSKYFQKWKQERFLEQASQPSSSAPFHPAPDQIFSAVQHVWQEMMALKEQELIDLQEAFAQEKLQWEHQEKQLRFEIADLQQRFLLKEKLLDELQNRFDSTQNELNHHIQQHHLLKTQHQQLLEQKTQQEKDFQLYAESLRSNLLSLTQTFETQSQRHQDSIKDLHTHYQQLLDQNQHHHQQRYDLLQKQLSELSQKIGREEAYQQVKSDMKDLKQHLLTHHEESLALFKKTLEPSSSYHINQAPLWIASLKLNKP